jgi:hypothetical protein
MGFQVEIEFARNTRRPFFYVLVLFLKMWIKSGRVLAQGKEDLNKWKEPTGEPETDNERV